MLDLRTGRSVFFFFSIVDLVGYITMMNHSILMMVNDGYIYIYCIPYSFMDVARGNRSDHNRITLW